MIRFECDYTEGAHPRILEALSRTNMEQTVGYSEDEHCENARRLIREACDCPMADVHFLVGGTQANMTVIAGILRPHQGVVSAESGHINVHETGAVEATGHNVEKGDNTMKNLVLNNGVLMPAIGFGTYAVTDGEGEEVIKQAVKEGYRLFDTAAFYDNEVEVGRALLSCGVDRSELFVTSKVWRTNLGYENVRASFEQSLERLGFEYLDMFLLHWPREDAENPEWKTIIQESWRALEDLYDEGKIKAIGLSNFLPHHLDVILEKARIKPAVNQLELHVGYLQETAVNYSKEHGIILQAWSPLGRMRVSEHKTIKNMAAKYGITTAQLLLGFLYNEGYCVIPKTSSKERLKANLDIENIEISREDTFILKTLPQLGWSGEHPDFVEV